jgi:hypothetical protein
VELDEGPQRGVAARVENFHGADRRDPTVHSLLRSVLAKPLTVVDAREAVKCTTASHRKAKITSKTQGPTVLAWQGEQPPALRTPQVARKHPKAIEPQQLAVIPLDNKHLRVAVRPENWVHTDNDPLANRLIRVLLSEPRPDLRHAVVQADRKCSFTDCVAAGGSGEAELCAKNLDEINLHLTGGNIDLAEGVIGPWADVDTLLPEGLAIPIGVSADAKPDRLLDSELRSHGFIWTFELDVSVNSSERPWFLADWCTSYQETSRERFCLAGSFAACGWAGSCSTVAC